MQRLSSVDSENVVTLTDTFFFKRETKIVQRKCNAT